MKLFLTAFFFAFFGIFSAVAQPVFHHENLIGGDLRLVYKTDYFIGDFNPSGINQEWDFSYLEGVEMLELKLADSEDFPELNPIQGANKVLFSSFENDEFDFHTFLKTGTDGLYRLNSKVDASLYAPYTIPFRELSFPVEYNENELVETTLIIFTQPSAINGSDSLRTIQTIEYKYSVPASGNLTLPNGFRHEVLAVRRQENITITWNYRIDGEWVADTLPQFIQREFWDFLSPELGYYIMMVELLEASENGNGYKIRYLNEMLTVGVKNVLEPSISVFPNPASDHFLIQGLKLPSSVQLFDLQGRQIKSWESGIENPLLIEFNETGIYLLRITNAEGFVLKKLVIGK